MVVIKKRTLLRCCHNCSSAFIDYDNDGIITCEQPANNKVEVESTGICQYFMRVIVNDKPDVTKDVQGQEPEEV